MKMTITLLGTGTSCGVPQIGCHCATCSSTDPRDKRLRCSALFQTATCNLLVDCGPDFREQMLRMDYDGGIDAVFITHEHYDHVGGIDDLRPFSYLHDLPLYADPYASEHLRTRLLYCLVENKYPGVPQLRLHTIRPQEELEVCGVRVVSLAVMHGRLPILGYRIGDVGYLTDMTSVDDYTVKALSGIRLLIVGALRHEPHPTHQTIEQAVDFAHSIGGQPTYFIHMSHHIAPHAREEALLPKGFYLGYDGLQLTVDGDRLEARSVF